MGVKGEALSRNMYKGQSQRWVGLRVEGGDGEGGEKWWRKNGNNCT